MARYSYRPKHSEETKRKLSEKAKLRKGNKASHWKGGKITVGGYIYVMSPDHPNRTKDGYVCEHRLVMEGHLGRLLTRQEVVHHINHDKTDNRVENLELCGSAGSHTVKHHVRRNELGRFC